MMASDRIHSDLQEHNEIYRYRLQRQLYGNHLVLFLTFMVSCNYKLVSLLLHG